MCTMCLCPCLLVASFTIGTDFYLFIYASFHLFSCVCVCERTAKEYEMTKSGQSKTTPGAWGMMTRKFILHFEHSVSEAEAEAEVVNNGSCPRQQYFIMMLLSSLAVFAMVLCEICVLLFKYIFVCTRASLRQNLLWLVRMRTRVVYMMLILYTNIFWHLRLTSGWNRRRLIGNQITLALEKKWVRFVLTQQQHRLLSFDLHKWIDTCVINRTLILNYVEFHRITNSLSFICSCADSYIRTFHTLYSFSFLLCSSSQFWELSNNKFNLVWTFSLLLKRFRFHLWCSVHCTMYIFDVTRWACWFLVQWIFGIEMVRSHSPYSTVAVIWVRTPVNRAFRKIVCFQRNIYEWAIFQHRYAPKKCRSSRNLQLTLTSDVNMKKTISLCINL